MHYCLSHCMPVPVSSLKHHDAPYCHLKYFLGPEKSWAEEHWCDFAMCAHRTQGVAARTRLSWVFIMQAGPQSCHQAVFQLKTHRGEET